MATFARRWIKDKSFDFLKRYVIQPSMKRNKKFFRYIEDRTISLLKYDKQSGLPQRHIRSLSPIASSSRTYQTQGGDNSSGRKTELQLMDFPKKVWPNPFKTIRNSIFSVIIRGYYDPSFTIGNFLKGAEQAVVYVSNIISEGHFEKLDGLVDSKALPELRRSYGMLNPSDRQLIRVDPEDLFFKFVYEIGMIFDDESNRRFVEITAVLQGFANFKSVVGDSEPRSSADISSQSKDSVYVCNYRFIREYTKGVEDEWIVNKLNHFRPADVVQGSDPFSR